MRMGWARIFGCLKQWTRFHFLPFHIQNQCDWQMNLLQHCQYLSVFHCIKLQQCRESLTSNSALWALHCCCSLAYMTWTNYNPVAAVNLAFLHSNRMEEPLFVENLLMWLNKKALLSAAQCPSGVNSLKVTRGICSRGRGLEIVSSELAVEKEKPEVSTICVYLLYFIVHHPESLL